MCFPSSDAQLQEAGDTLNGLVLVDESEGVVGYCLYNIEEHYISDMAVLPEYRKDKNSSSLKLLNEIVKKVRDIGGEWSAELRDNTSLRYMKTMAKRGLVDLKIVELDHEMSDGSKVYKVKFTPQNAPVRANNVSRVTKPVGKGRE